LEGRHPNLTAWLTRSNGPFGLQELDLGLIFLLESIVTRLAPSTSYTA
jgi:hypothetical protein